MENITPMLAQYQQIKARHPDSILFFRLGDFYEMFYDDARRACGILDVVLTSRDAGKAGKAPMCGIPFHAADTYVAKLIKAGLKVAICEQVEDPALAKGIVGRDVVRVVTSGTFIDESSPEARSIACLAWKDKKIGIAFTDTASGAIRTCEFDGMAQAVELLAKNFVYELVYPAGEEEKVRELLAHPPLRSRSVVLSPFEDWAFNSDICRKTLCGHFHTASLDGFGISDLAAGTSASGALLEYLKSMHKQPLRHIDRLSLYADSDFVFISPAACFGLELELLSKTIDHTRTALGKRALRDWLYHPLKNPAHILKRQQAVTMLKENSAVQQSLGQLLRGIPDIEKSVSRISCATATARDLASLRSALDLAPEIARSLAGFRERSELFSIADLPSLREYLDSAVNPDIPLSHPEGKIINRGFSAELDELREIQANGNAWLKNLQAAEIRRTGINSLKIGFNTVFGYYIEVSNANLERAPADYIRKQTLTNAERFITQALKEFEEKMLTAEEKILKLENELIRQIFGVILDNSAGLHTFAADIARLDCLYSLSITAAEPGYSAPRITQDYEICIKDGRHPVVEKAVIEPFISNDTLLDCSDNHLVVLTGPNMAGKSTYIRQTALLVILAQMGSFIPAAEASIGIVDKIFTRIGAHDEITRGMSTFMVEMSEAAGILNNLSQRSLVILDEVGRGTSTFDGLSLAWSIAEFLAQAKVRTLFATHFHELTALAEEFPGVKNYNVSVKEWNDQVVFLHKISPGGTDDSYGIYVAKLAGIPTDVVVRARKILARLETGDDLQEKIRNRTGAQRQLSLFGTGTDALAEEIKKELQDVDVDNLTPLQALNILQGLRKKIRDYE
ncbi:MAG: DNA mismatch repair protein MutS [Candidatus Omnitrophica bacterium]|nr:DNA mismatch repair protein MutS [Candidatus Omnitrophota bacterium]